MSKKSSSVALVLMTGACALPLFGAYREFSRPSDQPDPSQDGSLYASVEACAVFRGTDACEAAQAAASATYAANVPRITSETDCTARFGSCVFTPGTDGSEQGWWSPSLAGFTFEPNGEVRPVLAEKVRQEPAQEGDQPGQAVQTAYASGYSSGGGWSGGHTVYVWNGSHYAPRTVWMDPGQPTAKAVAWQAPAVTSSRPTVSPATSSGGYSRPSFSVSSVSRGGFGSTAHGFGGGS